MAEIGNIFLGREMWRMRQSRKRRNTIHRGIENELRPLGGPRIFEGFRFQSASNYHFSSFSDGWNRGVSWLEWSEPSGSIQFVLHMCIAVTRAAHKCRASNDQTLRMLGNNFFTAQSVLSGDDGTPVEMFTGFRNGFFHLCCLSG